MENLSLHASLKLLLLNFWGRLSSFHRYLNDNMYFVINWCFSRWKWRCAFKCWKVVQLKVEVGDLISDFDVDDNEHIVKGKLARHLNNLVMVEYFCTRFDPSGGPTSYFRGRYQIDGFWYTCSIVTTAVTIYPYRFGLRDHRAHLVDFQTNSMFCELYASLSSLNKRCLTWSFPIIVQRYLERAEANFNCTTYPPNSTS